MIKLKYLIYENVINKSDLGPIIKKINQLWVKHDGHPSEIEGAHVKIKNKKTSFLSKSTYTNTYMIVYRYHPRTNNNPFKKT